MTLTKKQAEAVDLAVKKYKNKEKGIVIAGPAGSGKSSSIAAITAALCNAGADIKDFVYAAPTGKAVKVLANKGNTPAFTLHKLLYNYKMMKDGTYIRSLKKELEYKIVVIDEVSMVPRDMWEDLIKFNVFIIASGDNAQLPPISGVGDNGVLNFPDIYLDEIMRQAQESEIIRLTMLIREGKKIPFMQGKEVMILPKKELSLSMLRWGDQNLCALNKTRTQINDLMRKADGRDCYPEKGDKVICCHNYWDTLSLGGEPLTNGTVGILQDFSLQEILAPWKETITVLKGDFVSETDDYFSKILMFRNGIVNGINPLTQKQEAWYVRAQRQNPNIYVPLPIFFNYGYAVTTWKAQGSEWDKVLVIEENFPRNKKEHQQFLYTACTRAAKKLVLLREE
jgi:exodeoxyribonuclease-5